MGRRGAAFVLGVIAAIVVGPPAAAHDVPGFTGLGKASVFTQMTADDPFVSGQPVDTSAREAAQRASGPCTDATARGMPEGSGHDHQDPAQHRNLRCAIEQVATLSLVDVLEREGFGEDVVLGEMDVKADVAGVSVTYPRAGILFFDVSDPAKPRFLSSYQGRECDAQPIDINCGAFTDLSADGKVAYLSVQNLSSIPGQPGVPGTAGIEVVDISDPRNPVLSQPYAIAATPGSSGVHTARSHVIPDSGGAGARAPGEYVFANRNGSGVTIGQVLRPGGKPQIVPVGEIEAPGLHDTFIQEDPIDRRTYLYLADGFDSGFKVYDVTDPTAPELLGYWDLTPECTEDWYAHTIDVAVRNGRRYVTLPVELFDGGDANEEEVAEGCNPVVGAANKAGPMWIVDATDFGSLAQADDMPADVKRKSESSLVTTWQNPAGRAGGNLVFSPHNQQIVGDKIYLSNYHGGVIVLDAGSAFDGRTAPPDAERPRETGFMVPRVGEPRPIFSPVTNPLLPFFTAFPLGRPHVWDLVVHKGHILTQDMSGGLYSLREVGGGGSDRGRGRGRDGSGGGRGDRGDSRTPGSRRARCSTPRGRVTARRIGGARLGVKRRANRRAFRSFSRRFRGRIDRFCLTDRRHVRVGYATRALARGAGSRRSARRMRGRAVLALSASRRYRARGVRPGARVGTLKRRVERLRRPYRRGANRWFVTHGRGARLVFRVRGGRVREVGVANRRLTRSRAAGRRLVRAYK